MLLCRGTLSESVTRKGDVIFSLLLEKRDGVSTGWSVHYCIHDDAQFSGPREWEAVDCTLFPRSLLPLIKFLLMSLVPLPSTPTDAPNPSISDPSENPHHLNNSALARQVVWACMVEDPRLFFRPLFNRFNRLYMAVSDQKSKRSHVEYLMVKEGGREGGGEVLFFVVVYCCFCPLGQLPRALPRGVTGIPQAPTPSCPHPA